VSKLIFSADGARVAVDAGKCHVIDVPTGHVTCRFRQGAPLCFVQGGAQLVVEGRDSLHLLDARTGKLVRTLPRLGGLRVAATSDGTQIVDLSDTDELRLTLTAAWETKPLRQLEWRPWRVFLSPNGRRLFLEGGTERYEHKIFGPLKTTRTRERNSLILDVETGKSVQLAMGSVYVGAFSIDGSRLALVSSEGCTLYDVATGEPIIGPIRHRGGVSCVAFSPKGDLLAIGGWNPRMTVWRLPPPPRP